MRVRRCTTRLRFGTPPVSNVRTDRFNDRGKIVVELCLGFAAMSVGAPVD